MVGRVMVMTHSRGGQEDWNVVEEDGNHILQKTGSNWTIISVDGVGFATDTNEVSFDDFIVADSEESLVLAVSLMGKLSVTWGEMKNFTLGY